MKPIEELRRQLLDWNNVFGHLGETPDAIGNAIHAEYDKRDAEIYELRGALKAAAIALSQVPNTRVPALDMKTYQLVEYLEELQKGQAASGSAALRAFKLGEEAYWEDVSEAKLRQMATDLGLNFDEMLAGYNHASDCDEIYQQGDTNDYD